MQINAAIVVYPDYRCLFTLHNMKIKSVSEVTGIVIN